MNYVFLSLALTSLLLFSSFFINKSKSGRKVFIVISSVYSVGYLIWRACFTIPTDSLANLTFALLLFIAEAIGHLQAIVFRVLFWEDYTPPQASIEAFPQLPTVDVLIATYNEPEDLLKLTTIGCLNIDYPKDKLNIYLCDDGRRQSVKELATQLGIGYITRDENKHAKAGNINNALTKTQSEFVLLLDADMVPNPIILKKIIPQFSDDKVGFVQTPQVFYNPDPFQYNLYLEKYIPNEQDLFMRKIQAGRARYNALIHVGTNAVFRRSALEEIGGIPYGSITEDILTGMLLQNNGYKSVFLKDTLALGLSPDQFADLVKQRDRWARGSIQIVKKWRICQLPGLNFMQKLLYTDSIVYWFYGLRKMTFLLSPLLVTFFGISIFKAPPLEVISIMIPVYLTTSRQFNSLFKKERSIAWAHIYDSALAPFAAWAIIRELFFPDTKFVVTPKDRKQIDGGINLKYAFPHLIVLLLNITAVILITTRLIQGTSLVYLYTINLFWIIYNSVGTAISLLLTIERPRYRAKERFNTNLSARVCCMAETNCCQEGVIVDISEKGFQVILPQPVQHKIGEVIKIQSDELGNTTVKIAWIKGNKIGLQFIEPNYAISKLIPFMFQDEAKFSGTIDSKHDDFREILLYELARVIRRP